SRWGATVTSGPAASPAAAVAGGTRADVRRINLLDIYGLVRDHQLLGQHAGVTGLHGADFQALGPGVGELVPLELVALVVEDDDRPALAAFAHLPEPAVLDPLLEAVVRGE